MFPWKGEKMNIIEFKNRIKLIVKFISKMNNETVPLTIQKIFIRTYASDLNINLTDKMIEAILIF